MRECWPQNAMDDPGEIAAFHDRASDLMRELLEALAEGPHRPRPFPEIEDAMGWPRRRISSVLGGAGRWRKLEFGGRRPYHFQDTHQSASGRWEMWMDPGQARAVLAEAGRAPSPARGRRAGPPPGERRRSQDLRATRDPLSPRRRGRAIGGRP